MSAEGRLLPRSLTEPVARAKAALEGHGDPTGRDDIVERLIAQDRLRLTLNKLRPLAGRTLYIDDVPVSVVELPNNSPVGKKIGVIAEFPRPVSGVRDHADPTDEGPRFRRLVEMSDSTIFGNDDLIRVTTTGSVGQQPLYRDPNPPTSVIDALEQFSTDLMAQMPTLYKGPTDEAKRALQAWIDEVSRPRYEDRHPGNGGAL